MAQLASFSHQALELAYSMEGSNHFKVHHDSMVEKVLETALKRAKTGDVRLLVASAV